jgi:serine protease
VEEDQTISLDYTRELLLGGVTQVPANPAWQSRFDYGQQRVASRDWNLDTNPKDLFSPVPPAKLADPYATNWSWATPAHYPNDGEGAMVWILDTGVKTNHDEFVVNGASRVIESVSFVDNEPSVDDLNGHGTHCAGTAAGNFRGLAKGATIGSIKVLGSSGGGTWAGVIAGVNWCADQAVNKYSGHFNVLSASLGGGAQQTVDDAFNAMVLPPYHVTAVVAMGNSNNNACRGVLPTSGSSPARAEEVIAVVASDSADNVASYSSWGPCAQSIAPGTSITSAWITPNQQTGNNWYNDISGTSMATPHVTGAVALYAHIRGRSTKPSEVKDALRKDQTMDKITGLTGPVKSETPNRFIYAWWGP